MAAGAEKGRKAAKKLPQAARYTACGRYGMMLVLLWGVHGAHPSGDGYKADQSFAPLLPLLPQKPERMLLSYVKVSAARSRWRLKASRISSSIRAGKSRPTSFHR